MSREPNYKLLDADDKSVLAMPPGAIKLWLFYRLYSDELDRSYYSTRTIGALTGMSTTTVVKWQRFLVAQKKIVDTGERAANQYSKPTIGSHKVPVIEAPVSAVSNIDTAESPQSLEQSAVSNFGAPKTVTKVIGIGVGIGSVSSSQSPSGFKSAYEVCESTYANPPKLPKTPETPDGKAIPKPEPQTKTPRKSLAPDGSTWSEWDAHDQVWKTNKLVELRRTKPDPKSRSMEQVIADPEYQKRMDELISEPQPQHVPPYMRKSDVAEPKEEKPQTQKPKPQKLCRVCGVKPGSSLLSGVCLDCYEKEL